MTDVVGKAITEFLAGLDDLDVVVRALAREHTIRQVVAETGEERQHVVDFLDAHISMDREAVLDLTDGEPTTLANALRSYVEELEKRDELQPRDRITGELRTILAYPWTGPELEIRRPDPEHLEVVLGGQVVETTYRQDGRSVFSLTADVANAVHRAHQGS